MSASTYFSGFFIGLSVGLFWGRTLGTTRRQQKQYYSISDEIKNHAKEKGDTKVIVDGEEYEYFIVSYRNDCPF